MIYEIIAGLVVPPLLAGWYCWRKRVKREAPNCSARYIGH